MKTEKTFRLTNVRRQVFVAAIYKTIAFAMLGICMGCTTVSVKPVDSSEGKISEVCIKKNPKVVVPEFTDIVEEGFLRHGIATKIYTEIPPSCKYSLTYTATQRWSYVMFLNDAHLSLYKENRLIGSADRDAPVGGGMEPSKWDSTRTKVDPMIDELLAGVAPLPQYR